MHYSIVKLSLAAAAMTAALTMASTPAQAQMEKATIAIPVNSISFLPVYIAADLGLWKNAGIDVKVTLVRGIGATNAVVAKSVEFSNGSGATVIRGNLRGRGLVALMNTVTRPAFVLVLSKKAVAKIGVSPDAPLAERARALKGLKIALSGLNNVSHTFLNYALSKGGLKQSDIQIVKTAPPSMYAALKKGDVDGFETAVPWPFIPIANGDAVTWISGLRNDMPELSDMPNTVLIARQGYCESQPSICRKVIIGYQGALNIIHNDPAAAKKVLQARFSKMDPALLEKTFNEMVRVAMSKTGGKFPSGGLASVQDFMLTAGHMKPSQKLSSFECDLNRSAQHTH